MDSLTFKRDGVIWDGERGRGTHRRNGLLHCGDCYSCGATVLAESKKDLRNYFGEHLARRHTAG